MALAILVGSAAVAAHAPSASAIEAIEVFVENTGTHCAPVTVTGSHMPGGGCEVFVNGQDIELSGHVVGVEQHILVCDVTFELFLGEDGTGYLAEMVIFGDSMEGSDACEPVRPCISEGAHGETHPNTEGNEAGEHAWPVDAEEIGGPDSEEFEAHATVCLHTWESIEECEGVLDLHLYEEQPASSPEHLLEAETIGNFDHTHTEASLPEGAGVFTTHCELTGHFDLEPAQDELHINHLGA